MKAAILYAPEDLVYGQSSDPKPDRNNLIVKVQSATVCGTDIRIFKGQKTKGINYPAILGHEFAGEIVHSDVAGSFSIGNRVALCPFISCGRCKLCKTGKENLCTNGQAFGYELSGAFAEYLSVPTTAVAAGNVKLLPEHVTTREAALLEPLACVINGQEKVSLRHGENVVILGAGPIGLLHLKLAKSKGAAKIIVSDPNEKRLEIAHQWGATRKINPINENIFDVVSSETDGEGAHVVICAIGKPELTKTATQVAAFGGRVSLFAGFSSGESADMDVNDIHYRELAIVGAFGLSRASFDKSFDLIASKSINLEELITDEFPLSDVEQAFKVAASGDAIKVLISPTSS